MAVATLAVAIGIVLMFIPGPAVLFFAIAGTLLASESRGVARFLDWTEVKIRQLVTAGLDAWRRWSWLGRAAAVAVVALLAAAAAILAYRVFFG